MPEPHGLHPATPCCPPVARSSHRPLPVPHGPGACRSPLRALPRGAGSPVLRPRAQGHRTQMAAPKPRQPQRPLCDPAAGGGAPGGWSRTPSAPVHATRTPVPASRGWLPLCFRRGEAPAASGALSTPQGCFHRPAGVALPSAGRTCSASGLGTRAGPHTPAAGRPAPRTVPGTSILTLQIAARPEILLLSFRISDSLAQPASSITRKTIT